ncbi:MAG TPA: hypothetical protein VHO72_06210 [Bacteroidales bacterium]|nr:hypothetical protein [Bacteroidales bacterium]
MTGFEQRLLKLRALNDWLNGYLLISGSDIPEEYSELDATVKQAHIYNPWFIELFNRRALTDFADWLKNNILSESIQSLVFDEQEVAKKIALLPIPNVALSGIEEAILLYLAGHRVVLRNKDHKHDLFQFLTQSLVATTESQDGLLWVNTFPRNIDGWVIFEQPNQNAIRQYFNIRKSIFLPVEKQFTVLNGNEDAAYLNRLADDIFIYWGFSPNNVRKLLVPEKYDFNTLFEALEKYSFLYQCNCYANNYDYHKSVLLMNRIPFLDNGFILLREDASKDVPIGCLHYSCFSTVKEENELRHLSSESKEHSFQNNSKLLMDFIQSF